LKAIFNLKFSFKKIISSDLFSFFLSSFVQNGVSYNSYFDLFLASSSFIPSYKKYINNSLKQSFSFFILFYTIKYIFYFLFIFNCVGLWFLFFYRKYIYIFRLWFI